MRTSERSDEGAELQETNDDSGKRKTFADGVRRAGGCLAALELRDDDTAADAIRRDVNDPVVFQVGFAGRFDDEM